MVKFIAIRLTAFIPIVLVTMVASFGLLYLSPNSPAAYILGEFATPDDVARLNAQLGLDRPFLEQFGEWFSDAIRGDFGTSVFSSLEVRTAVTGRIPATVSLATLALVIAVVVGVTLGVIGALRSGGAVDRLLTMATSAGLAIPSFWLGIVLSYVFGVQLGWLPVTGYVPLTEDPWAWFEHLVLPSVCLGLPSAAVLARHTRNALLEALTRDYVRTARAKGLSRRRVLLVHVLKNAAVPVVTLTGTQFIALLGGTVIIESIFGITGVGSLAVRSALQKDIPVIQGLVVYSTLIVLVVNLVVDLAYAALDPRMRRS